MIKICNFADVIELEKHIEILLLTNDCVIVPGLGGFTASHVAARYDDNDGLYIPPSRTLGFNSKLNINDSLLVQSYSEAYDMSFPEAFNRLEDEITELKQHVSNEGYYELNDIGTLYLNDDGNIEFSPCEAGILTPYLYSLSSFEIKKLSAATDKDIREDKPVRAAFKQPSIIKQNEASLNESDDEGMAGDRQPRKKYVLLRNAAAIVLLIISFLIFSEPVNDKSGMTRMSNFDTGIVHNLINNGYKNITGKKDIKLKNLGNKANITKDVKKEATAAAKQPVATEESPYYCIVLASKVTKRNADDFTRRLKALGFDDAKVLTEKGKSVKVVYGRYKTKNEAYNALNNLKGNEPFYDAWIYQAV